MSTSLDYITFVCDRIHDCGLVRFKKMFGEYMVYVDDKPILLVCDNTVFVKILPETSAVLATSEKGFPYDGAKEHFILDIEDSELCDKIIPILRDITPVPKKRAKKTAR